jgi:iron complex outermembrane receptor protein
MYQLINMRFLLLFLLAVPTPLFSQIQGQVMDAESNEPISWASVSINHKIRALTDKYGRFQLDSVNSADSVSVSHPGYFDYLGTVNPSAKEMIIRLSPDPHQLAEVVVSDQMQAQKLKSLVGNLSLLTHSDLQRSSGITVADYLNQVPGVFMQQGALNTNRLTIRGVGSRTPYTTNRIKAYYDEIPLTTGDGSTTLEDIDIAAISRVEVLKGPSSALYGAGLGGVVRFYPLSQLESGNTVHYNSQAGSYGTFKNDISSSLKFNNYAITTILSNIYSDGYRQNSRYKRSSAFIFGSRYGKKSNLKATFNLIDLNSRIPSSLDEKTFDQSPQSAAKNWLAIKGYEDYVRMLGGVTYSTLLSKQLLNQATLFTGSLDHYQSRPFNILWENSIDYGVRDRMTFSKNNSTVVAGFEWFNEDYKWKIYDTNSGARGALTSHNKENRNYANIFALWTLNLQDKFVLETGVNFNTLGYSIIDLFPDSINTSGRYRYKPVISPKFGINYQAMKNVNFYVSLGHGFSAPSLQETLLPDGQPNPNLKPEEGYDIDLGTRLNLLDNRVYLEVTQYWMFLRNLLVTKRLTEDIFTGENAGETNHRGIEVTLKYSVLPEAANANNAIDLSLTYTNSLNLFKTFVDTGGNYSGKRLPGIPSDVLNLNASFKIQRVFHLFVDYQQIGSQYMTDNNSKRYNGYHLVGLKVEYGNANFKNYHLSCYVGVQNLFDERYAAMILENAPKLGTTPPRYYYPGNPRSFYVGVSVGIGK